MIMKKQRERLKEAIIKSEKHCKVIQKILNNAIPTILINCAWVLMAKKSQHIGIINIISFLFYFILWVIVTWYIWAVPSFFLLKRYKVPFIYYALVVMMVVFMFIFTLQPLL